MNTNATATSTTPAGRRAPAWARNAIAMGLAAGIGLTGTAFAAGTGTQAGDAELYDFLPWEVCNALAQPPAIDFGGLVAPTDILPDETQALLRGEVELPAEPRCSIYELPFG